MSQYRQTLEPHPGPPKKRELGFDFFCLFLCLRRGFFNWQVLAHMIQIYALERQEKGRTASTQSSGFQKDNLDNNTLFSGPDHSSPSLKLYFVLENSKI